MPTESCIEQKVCQYAKSKGWLVYKFTSPNNRGVPDRLLLKDGKTVFIEFKAPGKKPSRLQDFVINQIRKQNFNVFVVDNLEEGRLLIDSI